MPVMMYMGFSELLIVVLTGGMVGGGGLLGYPPGDRDPAFVQTAPADSLVFFEWAERSGGKPGAEGIDGLAADPEIRLFLERLEGAILAGMNRGLRNEGPEAQAIGKAVPPMVKLFLRQPGCLFARFDEEAAAKALTQGGQLGPAAVALGIEGAVVVNAGDGADELQRHIESLLNLPGAIPPAQRARNLAHQILPLPTPAAHLELHREGSYFVLAFGTGVAEEVVAGLTGKSKEGIAKNERFGKALAHADMARTASVAWLDTKGILDVVVETLGFNGQMVSMVAKSTGLDKVDSVLAVGGVVDGRLASKCFVTTGGSLDGVLALAAGRGITAEDLAVVPGDADLVYSFSLDSKKILAAVRDVVTKSDPTGFAAQQMNEVMKQLDEELGFSIENDALEAFGDTWIVFDSPSAGGLLLTGVTASLDVRDHEKAEKVYGRVMELIEAQMPGIEQGGRRRGGAELAKESFMDHEIRFVNIFDDDVPFSPAFCLTKSHVLVAAHPQSIKAQLRYLASDEEGFGTRLGTTIPKSDDPAISVGYLDARLALRGLYAFAPMFGSSFLGELQREGVDMNSFAIPSGRAILPYAKETWSRCTRTEDGILVESHNGLPIPAAGTFFLQMPIFLLAANDVRVGAPMAPRRAVGGKVAVPAAVVAPRLVIEKAKEERAKDAEEAKAAAKKAEAKAEAKKAAAEKDGAKADKAPEPKSAPKRRTPEKSAPDVRP